MVSMGGESHGMGMVDTARDDVAASTADAEERLMASPSDQDLPRAPLRVPRSGQVVGHPAPDAPDELWQTLSPDDAAYESAYQRAARAYHAYAMPMPYADSQDAGDAGGE